MNITTEQLQEVLQALLSRYSMQMALSTDSLDCLQLRAQINVVSDLADAIKELEKKT